MYLTTSASNASSSSSTTSYDYVLCSCSTCSRGFVERCILCNNQNSNVIFRCSLPTYQRRCSCAPQQIHRVSGRTGGRTQLWNYLASFQVCDIASWHGRGGGDADCASLLRPRRRADHQEWCQDRMLPKKLREERRCQPNSSARQLFHILFCK